MAAFVVHLKAATASATCKRCAAASTSSVSALVSARAGVASNVAAGSAASNALNALLRLTMVVKRSSEELTGRSGYPPPPGVAPKLCCKSDFIALSCWPQYSQLCVPYGGKLNTAL